jgi:putative tricarboxylic transport membrane protein
MLGLGVFVFLIRKVGFHPGPIGLGIILGPIIEPALVQAMFLSDAKSVAVVFFGSTVDIVLISATILSIAFVAWSRRRERLGEDADEPVKPVEPAGA